MYNRDKKVLVYQDKVLVIGGLDGKPGEVIVSSSSNIGDRPLDPKHGEMFVLVDNTDPKHPWKTIATQIWDGIRWINIDKFNANKGFISVPTHVVQFEYENGIKYALIDATTEQEAKDIITLWIDGFNEGYLAWPDSSGELHKISDGFFTEGDMFAIVAPIGTDNTNVIWVQMFKDLITGQIKPQFVKFGGAASSTVIFRASDINGIDNTKKNVLYAIDDMNNAQNAGSYVFQPGDRGFIVLDSTSTPISHLSGESAYKHLMEEINKIGKTSDFSALTTQAAIDNKLTTDKIVVGDKVILTIDGKKEITTLIKHAGTDSEFIYQIFKTDATGATTVENKVVRVDGTNAVAVNLAGETTIQNAKKFTAAEKATDDNDLIRKKEFDEELLKKITLFEVPSSPKILSPEGMYKALMKATGDLLKQGDKIKISINGQEEIVTMTVVDDAFDKNWAFNFIKDIVNAKGEHKSSIVTVGGGTEDKTLYVQDPNTLAVTIPVHKEIQQDQIFLGQAASIDEHAVREKEFVKVKDRSILNELAVSVLKNETFSITSASYIEAFAEFLDHEQAVIPTVDLDGAAATYATWFDALTANLVLDTIFDPSDGDWITKPEAIALGFSDPDATKIAKSAQWAKVQIVDAMKALPISKQPIKLDLSFRPYASPLAKPPVISTVHDQLLLTAKKNLDLSRLAHEFMSLVLYQESDQKISLQAIIDRASGAAPGDGFQVINVIKSIGLASNTKFENGDPVNQQKEPAYGKTAINTWRKDVYKVEQDAQDKKIKALEDKPSVVDYTGLANGQDVVAQAVTDKLVKGNQAKVMIDGKPEIITILTSNAGKIEYTYDKITTDATGIKFLSHMEGSALSTDATPIPAGTIIAMEGGVYKTTHVATEKDELVRKEDVDQALEAKMAKDGAGGENKAEAGKYLRWDPITGKLIGSDIPKGAKVTYYNLPFGETTLTAVGKYDAGGVDASGDDLKESILILRYAGDNRKYTYDDVQIYRSTHVSDGNSDKWEWILMNPRHASQGVDAYKVIDRTIDHIGNGQAGDPDEFGPETWTNPDGFVGYRQALFMDFNFQTDPVDTFVDKIGVNKYTIHAASSRAGQADSVLVKIATVPASAYDSDEIKISMKILTAWRQGTSKLAKADYVKALNDINAWYLNPTPANLKKVNDWGFSRGYLYPKIWKDKHLSTLNWNLTPTPLYPDTDGLSSDADLNKLVTYVTKDANGVLEFWEQTSFASARFGGHISIVQEFEISDVEAGHVVAGAGAQAGAQKDITQLQTEQKTINRAIGVLAATKVDDITSLDGTVVALKTTFPGHIVKWDLSVPRQSNPIDSSSEIEKVVGIDPINPIDTFRLTTTYKTKLKDDTTKEITDADKALETKLKDEIEKERYISDAKSAENWDSILGMLDSYGLLSKVSDPTGIGANKFALDPFQGSGTDTSAPMNIKPLVAGPFVWNKGVKTFVKVYVPTIGALVYEGHGAGNAIIDDIFGAPIKIVGERKVTQPATFNLKVTSAGEAIISGFNPGNSGIKMEEIQLEYIAQSLGDTSLVNQVNLNKQGVIDVNKLATSVVDALDLKKIYEMPNPGAPILLTQVGTSNIWKGQEHIFDVDYPAATPIRIELQDKTIITVPLILTEADIDNENVSIDLPDGSGDHIHVAVLKTEVVPNTVPKTWTYQIVVDDKHRNLGDPTSVNANLGYIEIVSSTEKPAPVDLSQYDSAATTKLKYDAAIAAAQLITNNAAKGKMNVNMDNFVGTAIPGFDNTVDQYVVKSAVTGKLKLVKPEAFKKVTNLVTLGALTGMADGDVAYVKSEKKWYSYDLANTKWVTTMIDDTKLALMLAEAFNW